MASKSFYTILSVLDDSNVYGHHLPVPLDISLFFNSKKISRFICTVNGHFEKRSALMPVGDGSDFILLNKQEVRSLGIAIGEKVEVLLRADTSKYGMEMPEEFAELLSQDEEGEAHFHALTPGKQRSLIYLVVKLKSTDARIRKAVSIVEYLKESNGVLDYKALNEAIKRRNRS